MKATMSKDGLNRINTTIKLRLNSWLLLVAGLEYSERSDSRLKTVSAMIKYFKVQVTEHGTYWYGENVSNYIGDVCDLHLEYYLKLLSEHFSESDIEYAREQLSNY